jgi:membrane associated rhomboid family serine protease
MIFESEFNIDSATFSGGDGGGVAYGAHIGGFIAGMLVIKLFTIRRKLATRPG